MTRRQAMQAETAAIEALKVAAINYAIASTGGDEPLRAGALLRISAKAYHAAASAVVDAIMLETPEERREHEGPVRPGARRTSVQRTTGPKGDGAA